MGEIFLLRLCNENERSYFFMRNGSEALKLFNSVLEHYSPEIQTAFNEKLRVRSASTVSELFAILHDVLCQHPSEDIKAADELGSLRFNS